jgi:hypothetical protein
MHSEDDLADDLLRGIHKIARFLGTTDRQAYYMAGRGLIPAFKRGKIWEARRSTLVRHIEKLETTHA